ncbi:MAG: tail fiber domain-containing protein [Candidatus Omnitrophica bacterium]|nr:tail fiber domain-containing protein [Candidatus Omnitrophota bacterium]
MFKNKVLLLVIVMLLAFFFHSASSFAATEQLSITTYYPAPHGVYKELTLYPNDDFATGAACAANEEGTLRYYNTGDQILVCDGATFTWQPLTGLWTQNGTDIHPNDLTWQVGIGTNTPEFKLDLNNDGGIIARGTMNSGNVLITSGAGTRLIWYPRKAAFRAGAINAAFPNQWDDANIGDYSVAFGLNSEASGDWSTVSGGSLCVASGDFSTVAGGGAGNTASANTSTISGGSLNTASGQGSVVAGGFSNTASGTNSMIVGGSFNEAAGDHSFAAGENMQLTTAADRTFAWGHSNVVETIATPDAFLIFPKGSAGSVGVRTDAPTEALDVNGNLKIRAPIDGDMQNLSADASGVVYRAVSSKRYKENIQNLIVNTDTVLKLNPVKFNWKSTEKAGIGLIAEDVDEIIPDLVVYNKEGMPESVRYDKVAIYLLEVVKELKAENDELKDRVKALESKI